MNSDFIDADLISDFLARLRALPRVAEDAFLTKFGVSRVRYLKSTQLTEAAIFLAELEAETREREELIAERDEAVESDRISRHLLALQTDLARQAENDRAEYARRCEALERGMRVPEPPGVRTAERIAALAPDERAILEQLLCRLEAGRRVYGPWQVDDGRDYRAEALEEILDALHYCAAALVSYRKGRGL